ncbi:EF-hand domain-containing protein [Seleniivibrio woodruffii]|uniref:EF-hand domain-containing protein n=1 Tax=Seleniivibrio woodruffii TaxID=1078050 RepID=UPI0024096E66|nr:EF-hand domain-containing protein [Seleniivibrio woodruffii]
MSISGVNSASQYLYQYGQNKVSGSKQQGGADAFFSKVDTSQDGTVDKSELLALVDEITSQTGQSVDTESLFAEFDTDGNGTYSDDELRSFMQSNDIRPKGGPGGPPPSKGEEGSDSEYNSSEQIISLLTSIQDSLNSLLAQSGSSSSETSGDDGSDQTDYVSLLQTARTKSSDNASAYFQSSIDRLMQGLYSQYSAEA